ncbi:hypothetical protein ABPG72_022794 [Tetrahymena utriculariae]
MATKKSNAKQQEAEQEALKAYDEKMILLKNAANQDVVQKMKIVIDNPPVKSKNQETLEKYVALFHSVLAAAKDRERAIVDALNDQEAVNLYDYINKSFELISSGKCKEDKFLSQKLFKMHAQLVDKFGKSIILKAISRQRSLITPIDNYPTHKDPNLL